MTRKILSQAIKTKKKILKQFVADKLNLRKGLAES